MSKLLQQKNGAHTVQGRGKRSNNGTATNNPSPHNISRRASGRHAQAGRANLDQLQTELSICAQLLQNYRETDGKDEEFMETILAACDTLDLKYSWLFVALTHGRSHIKNAICFE